MKILFVTDTHISAKSPKSRTETDITLTFLEKFKEVLELAKEYNVDALIHGGDMFHYPDVSNKVVGSVASLINEYNIPFYVVPGNHDIQGQNIESLPFTKLGLLGESDVVKIFTREDVIEFDNNINIYAQEYYYDIDKDNKLKDYAVPRKEGFNILVTHSMLLKEKFFEEVAHTITKDVVTDANIILSGHYHNGIEPHIENDTLFINPGSLFRGELSAHNKDAIPQVLILEVDKDHKVDYSLVKLKSAKAFEEVFNLSLLDKRSESKELEEFNKLLRDITFDDIDIIDSIEKYAKDNEGYEECVDLIRENILLHEVSSFVPKEYEARNERVHIKEVNIQNFQKHSKLKVDFNDGVNCIVGSSNSGKTSILRAISWVLYNTPKGSDFIKTGESKCSVSIKLSNGYTIVRTKTRSSSGNYMLFCPNGANLEFKGFANNIPFDIINAHQMPEVSILDKKCRFNISSQLEGPFLIGSSPTERLAMIGALVDTDRADKTMKEFRSRLSNISSSEKVLTSDILRLEEELLKYQNLDETKKKIDLIENGEKALNTTNKKITYLKTVSEKYDFISDKVESLTVENKTLRKKIVSTSDLRESIDCLEMLLSLRDKTNSNNKKIHDIENSKASRIALFAGSKEISDLKDAISRTLSLKDLQLKSKKISKKESDLVKISEFHLSGAKKMKEEFVLEVIRIKSLNELKVEMDALDKTIKEKIKISEKLNSTLKELNKEKDDLLKQIDSVGYVCVECGAINMVHNK